MIYKNYLSKFIYILLEFAGGFFEPIKYPSTVSFEFISYVTLMLYSFSSSTVNISLLRLSFVPKNSSEMFNSLYDTFSLKS